MARTAALAIAGLPPDCTDTVAGLILDHKILARSIASSWLKKRPWLKCESEEVNAAALRGLWDAAKKFQPERGLKFSTYAASRILGEIGDWKRKEFGRKPRPFKCIAGMRVYSPGPECSEGIDVDLVQAVAIHYDSPSADLDARDEFEEVIRPLLANEREAMRMRALGYTMKQIGQQLQLSESRISQLFSKITIQLRERYGQ